MNRKEFIKKINKVKDRIEDDYGCYTCVLIMKTFGQENIINDKYHKFISRYLVDDSFLKEKENRHSLRLLLVESFKQEVLSSGIYREF